LPEAASESERSPPAGVHRAAQPKRCLRVPDIPVRCRKQAPDEPPMFVRSRFGWDVREVSGALGDLGTFLPHIIGAITVVGMDPTGVLTVFGLFYLFTGAFYGVPIAVQPMKASRPCVFQAAAPNNTQAKSRPCRSRTRYWTFCPTALV